MKSKKNLTRFTYDTTAFQGWRLCISRGGTTFTKYFSDKAYDGPKKTFKIANDSLEQLKELLDGARRINGKLTKTTISKANKFLKSV